MSKAKTPITYKLDYDPDDQFEHIHFSIAQPGGVKTTITVSVAKVKSIDFFLTETVNKLDQVKRASMAPSDGPRHFAELERCLAGRAMNSFCKIKQEYFPDPGDETVGNYDDFVQLICTDLFWPTSSRGLPEVVYANPCKALTLL